MIRKILLLASYVLSTTATLLAAFSLFSILNLKEDLLEIVKITDYQTFLDFDNVLKNKYLLLGAFAFTALASIVCLIAIVVGKSESVHFVYIEKQKPMWAADSHLPVPNTNEPNESDTLTKKILAVFATNSIVNSTQDYEGNEVAIFKAICEVTNVSAGICYLPDSSFTNFKQHYTFAIREPERGKQVFALNHGLIGQAAADLKHKVFKSVPTNYLNIESGIGSLIPSTLLIFPFFNPQTKNCTMVIELAYFSDLNQAVISALTEINYQIASDLVPLEV